MEVKPVFVFAAPGRVGASLSYHREPKRRQTLKNH